MPEIQVKIVHGYQQTITHCSIKIYSLFVQKINKMRYKRGMVGWILGNWSQFFQFSFLHRSFQIMIELTDSRPYYFVTGDVNIQFDPRPYFICRVLRQLSYQNIIIFNAIKTAVSLVSLWYFWQTPLRYTNSV